MRIIYFKLCGAHPHTEKTSVNGRIIINKNKIYKIYIVVSGKKW